MKHIILVANNKNWFWFNLILIIYTRRMLRYAPRFHKKNPKKIPPKNVQKKISKKIFKKK
jgi:hypothetical protein